MNHHRSGATAPWSFFVGVGALAVPFWVLGPRADPWLQARLPMALPSSALWFVCPVIVALVLTYREAGPVGVTALLKRSVDARNIRRKLWYMPIVLLWPLMMSVEYGILKLAGAALPDPHIPLVMVPVFFGAFSISAWCEQLGWTGYATDPLQRRWGALAASVIVGVIWALGHVVPLIQAHRPPAWIVWQCLGMIPFRILITWISNNTGHSVFATIVFHATSNVSQFLFPTYGSHYDPFLMCLILAFTAALVTVMWGPQTLAHDGVISSRGRHGGTQRSSRGA